MKRYGPYRNTAMVAKQGRMTRTIGPKSAPDGGAGHAIRLPGRPRSEKANRAILDAARDLLVEEGFTRLRLEQLHGDVVERHTARISRDMCELSGRVVDAEIGR